MIRKMTFLSLLTATLTSLANQADGTRLLRSQVGRDGQSVNRTYQFQGHSFPLHRSEVVPKDEMAAIEGTNQVFTEFFRRKYQKSGSQPYVQTGAVPVMPGSLRGVHPKAHGCVTGTLKVSNDLDLHDQTGIFKSPGQSYQVVARFSNGSPHPERPDSASDSRGFGLKVLGVEGTPLLQNIVGGETGTQEFTMNSSDSFFADKASSYQRFMQISLLETDDFATAAKNFILELFAGFKPFVGTRVLTAFKKIQSVEATNPLALQYFSITAFQHGSGSSASVVKYSLVPCEGTWKEAINHDDPNFLRANLRAHIESKPACFRFLVQHQTDPSLSVEDPTQPWSEVAAPFREVAEINFPAQNLMNEMTCEKEVINPWNTLAEHKPVGGINRLRLGAYILSIEARKKSNRY